MNLDTIYSDISLIANRLNTLIFPSLLPKVYEKDKFLYRKILYHKNVINTYIKNLLSTSEIRKNKMLLLAIFTYMYAIQDLLILLMYSYGLNINQTTSFEYRFSDYLNRIKALAMLKESFNFTLKWLDNVVITSLVEIKKQSGLWKHTFIEQYTLIEQEGKEDIPDVSEENKASEEENREIVDILGGGGDIDGEVPFSRKRDEGEKELGEISPDYFIVVDYLKKLTTLVVKMKLFAPPELNDYFNNLLSYLDSIAQYLNILRDKGEITEEDNKKIYDYKQQLRFFLRAFRQENTMLPNYQALQNILKF